MTKLETMTDVIQHAIEHTMTNIIQDAIKHWLKPGDIGVAALHFENGKTFVDIEWNDGVSMFDCDKVLALIEVKQKISKDDLFDYCR